MADSILWSISKEVGKGALSAIGGQMMTGLFSLIGLGDSTSEEMNESLKQISGQLRALEQGMSRLHEDLQIVDRDLRRIDKDIVNEARKGRMQYLAHEMNRAELIIEEKFKHLVLIPRLGADDREAAMRKLTTEILEDDRVEYALDLLSSNLIGVEGAEGALQLLGQYYEADIESRKGDGAVYDYVENVYDRRLVPYFSNRIGVQLQGAVLLMNAYAADPEIKDKASRETRINAASDSFCSSLRQQCDAFGIIARNLSLSKWPHEYFYYREDRPAGVPDYEYYLSRSILAKADALTDAMLGGDGRVVVRIFVTHCSHTGTQQDRAVTARASDAIVKAINDHLPGSGWWNGTVDFPAPQVNPDLSDWPPFSPKMRQMILQENAQLIEHRLPSAGISAERADFLGEYLRTIQANVPPEIRLRDAAVPLFSPRFSNVRFPLNEHHLPAGSLNIATYYEPPGKG